MSEVIPLPAELLTLVQKLIWCRDSQVGQLYQLLGSPSWAPQTLVVHGVEATGKTLTLQTLLPHLSNKSALLPCRECVTTRHLLERTISSIKNALATSPDHNPPPETHGRCENMAAFVAQLQILLKGRSPFILVYDNIDQQREPAPTLLPALARLGQLVPNLTTILISTRASPHTLRNSNVLYLHFPPYTREESLTILSHSRFPHESLGPNARTSTGEAPKWTYNDSDTQWLWARYVGHIWDSLGQPAARDLISFQSICEKLWRPFIQPVIDGHYGVRGSQELSKLLVRHRNLLQSEAVLTSSIVPIDPTATEAKTRGDWNLPYMPAILLLSAYLASTTQPKHDSLLFSGASDRKRRKRGGAAVNRSAHGTPGRAAARKLPRRLLGPQAFGMERMLAIFHSLTEGEVMGGGAEVLGQFATLVSLRLVVKAGVEGQDVLAEGGGKWRCVAGEEVCRGLARGVGVDLQEYVLE